MLTIRMLGELEVEHDGERVVLPGGRRACALLAWLALNPGRHRRPRLAARFWPDVPDASARASLRSAVWALRSSLGAGASHHLVADRDTVALAGDGADAAPLVDLREFDRLVAVARHDEALTLCRGELLAGIDDEWVYEVRDEHTLRLATAYDAAARDAEARGDVAAALPEMAGPPSAGV